VSFRPGVIVRVPVTIPALHSHSREVHAGLRVSFPFPFPDSVTAMSIQSFSQTTTHSTLEAAAALDFRHTGHRRGHAFKSTATGSVTKCSVRMTNRATTSTVRTSSGLSIVTRTMVSKWRTSVPIADAPVISRDEAGGGSTSPESKIRITVVIGAVLSFALCLNY
jgi:hypothetical protein